MEMFYRFFHNTYHTKNKQKFQSTSFLPTIINLIFIKVIIVVTANKQKTKRKTICNRGS